MTGHSSDGIILIASGIDFVCFIGAQQRTDDRHVACRFIIFIEEINLSSQDYGTYGVIRQVVTLERTSTSNQILPPNLGIRDDLTDKKAKTVLLGLCRYGTQGF